MSEEKTNDEKINAIDPDNSSSLSNSDSLQEHQEEQAENTEIEQAKKARLVNDQLEKLAKIKQQQPELNDSETIEIDRMAQQQRKLIQEKNDKWAYMIEIKKEQARTARLRIEHMNRLAKKQLNEINRGKSDHIADASVNQENQDFDPTTSQTATDNDPKAEKRQRLEQLKQEQQRIAQEEAEQMNQLAQQQRANMDKQREEMEVKRQQKAYAMQLEQAVHEQRISEHYEDNALHHEYDDNTFTEDQKERFFRTYNSIFLGLLFSSGLLMFMFTDATPIVVAASVSFGLFALMVLNRKIINFFLSAIAVTIYGYMGWMEHEALDADVLLSAFNFIVQPIGFYLWYREIEAQKRLKCVANPEIMKQSIFDFRVTVRRLPTEYVKYWVLITMALASIWYAVLSLDEVFISYNHEHTGVSYLDVITNTLGVIGQLFLILRYREQWIVWIVVNLLHAFLWYSSMTPVAALQWVLLFGNACFALYIWSKESQVANTQSKKELSKEEALVKKLQNRSE